MVSYIQMFLNRIVVHGNFYCRYVWDKFRTLSRLETKFDGTLTDYLIGYVAMCKSVLGKKISEREQAMVDDLIAVPEERAELVLDRIEMMNTIRDEVIPHPELGERLRLCDTALDLPDWWVPGRHDKDLLYGAARHGLSRMEYFVLNDPELSFRDILKRHLTAEPLLDKKAMREFVERKKTWKIPDEVKEEEAVAEAVEEAKEVAKKDEKSKADEYEFKDEEEEEAAEKPPEKSKKDKRRKSSDKSKASEEEPSEVKEENASPKKSKKEKEKEKEKEESPKVEEMREARSRRKSTKDASEATRLALEAEKMVKEMERKEKKEKKQDKKKEKEREKEKEKEKAKEEETKKEEEEAKDKEEDFEPEQKVVNFPPSSSKDKKEEQEGTEEVKAKKEEEEEVKKEENATPPPPQKRKVQVSIPPPNITMQQMEQGRRSIRVVALLTHFKLPLIFSLCHNFKYDITRHLSPRASRWPRAACCTTWR